MLGGRIAEGSIAKNWTFRVLLVGYLAAVLAGNPAQATETVAAVTPTLAPPQFIVGCYDAERDLVTHVLTSECSGKIVSDAEAATIETKHEREFSRRFGRQTGSEADIGLPGSLHPGRDETALQMVSLGTGFYVDPGGSVLTDYHVVAGCTAMRLRLQTGRTVSAATIAVDADNDLALLHATEASPAVAQFEPNDQAAPATPLWIVGYPDEGLPRLVPVTLSGTLMLSDQQTAPKGQFVFHAAVRHGESGGPVLNADGGVIGAVKAKINSVYAYRQSGQMIENLGLGIPSRIILDFLHAHQVSVSFIRTSGGVRSVREDAGSQEPPWKDQTPPYIVRAECLR